MRILENMIIGILIGAFIVTCIAVAAIRSLLSITYGNTKDRDGYIAPGDNQLPYEYETFDEREK